VNYGEKHSPRQYKYLINNVFNFIALRHKSTSLKPTLPLHTKMQFSHLQIKKHPDKSGCFNTKLILTIFLST